MVSGCKDEVSMEVEWQPLVDRQLSVVFEGSDDDEACNSLLVEVVHLRKKCCQYQQRYKDTRREMVLVQAECDELRKVLDELDRDACAYAQETQEFTLQKQADLQQALRDVAYWKNLCKGLAESASTVVAKDFSVYQEEMRRWLRELHTESAGGQPPPWLRELHTESEGGQAPPRSDTPPMRLQTVCQAIEPDVELCSAALPAISEAEMMSSTSTSSDLLTTIFDAEMMSSAPQTGDNSRDESCITFVERERESSQVPKKHQEQSQNDLRNIPQLCLTSVEHNASLTRESLIEHNASLTRESLSCSAAVARVKHHDVAGPTVFPRDSTVSPRDRLGAPQRCTAQPLKRISIGSPRRCLPKEPAAAAQVGEVASPSDARRNASTSRCDGDANVNRVSVSGHGPNKEAEAGYSSSKKGRTSPRSPLLKARGPTGSPQRKRTRRLGSRASSIQ